MEINTLILIAVGVILLFNDWLVWRIAKQNQARLAELQDRQKLNEGIFEELGQWRLHAVARLDGHRDRIKLHEEWFNDPEGLRGFQIDAKNSITELEEFAASVKKPRITNQTTYRCIPNEVPQDLKPVTVPMDASKLKPLEDVVGKEFAQVMADGEKTQRQLMDSMAAGIGRKLQEEIKAFEASP